MKVFVGMSGGVDSSVVATELVQEGHEVVGVFIKGWYPEGILCTWKEDRQDAMRVAAHLGIPFLTLDLSHEYKTSVIDYLINEYKEGRTPNPDVLCNRDIKFGAFLTFAREQGADKVATGHYAKVTKQEDGTYALLRGKDPKKDQSYFLYTLTQEELQYILFPLGDLIKEETRRRAQKYKLPVAKKPDSQGLCFIGHVDMESFLKQYIHTTQGDVLDISGDVIGSHEGAVLYTLGQRHGFALNTPSKEPLYVLYKDIRANTITVGPESSKKDSAPESVRLRNVSWTTTVPENTNLIAQYRYHGPEVPITLEEDSVVFTTLPKEALAEGQALVLYRGEHCLGGGNIVY